MNPKHCVKRALPSVCDRVALLICLQAANRRHHDLLPIRREARHEQAIK